ncbi:unnamed protein product [Clonostachys rosea]|uniref:NACHT domain-containing protein n=1 Tax=Bionectria ochroleuca TaxID=29856 RepID=A0ABY6UC78_BIOOC|nr:unnamed protein product [Clonostachys rosea]
MDPSQFILANLFPFSLLISIATIFCSAYILTRHWKGIKATKAEWGNDDTSLKEHPLPPDRDDTTLSQPLKIRGHHDLDQPLHSKINSLISDTPKKIDVKLYFVERIWPELESDYGLVVQEMKKYCARHVKVSHTLTGRVKSRDSIEKSIKRREEYRIRHKEGSYTTLDEIFKDMHDLAGIRITVDFLCDTEQANKFIKETFEPTKDPNIFQRDRSVGKQWKALFGAYESTNHHVTVKPGVRGISHKFDKITFEIQVTCLAEGLYNKLAHPLLYKEKSGSISRKDEMVIDLSHGVALCFSICHLLMQDKLDDRSESLSEPGLRDAMIQTADDPDSEPSREAMDALAKLTPEVIPDNVKAAKGSNLKSLTSSGKRIPVDSLLGALSEFTKEADSNEDLWTCLIKELKGRELGLKVAIENQTEKLIRFQMDGKDEKCLQDLLVINPEDHKALIERTKGGLLEDAYRWILQHEGYSKFRGDPARRLLWIKGDPGKGKTMLLCGIIDELKKETTQLVTYFFCQATQEKEQRSASAILRSLIWLLCQQRPGLVSHIRESYNVQGKKLFEDLCALDALTKILDGMLCDPVLENAIFVIDALDECSKDERNNIIHIIIQLSKKFDAKWIVSSRNWADIEGHFRSDCSNIEVSLELNKSSISEAVKSFIQRKVDDLERLKRYSPETKQEVLETLQGKASDTFLWAALVCAELAETELYDTIRTLRDMPEGLKGLYGRMIEQVLARKYRDVLKQILAATCAAFRPMTFDELYTIVTELRQSGIKPEYLGDIIKDCGSFLTTQERIVYFVHQSAKEFLVDPEQISRYQIPLEKSYMFERSLTALKSLKKNIYNLGSPGVLIEEIARPVPGQLAGLEYPCVFWVDHLKEIQNWHKRIQDDIEAFIQRHLLNWLEAASLLEKMPEAVEAVKKFRSIIEGKENHQKLQSLAEDMQRFVFFSQQGIKMAPLQVYGSALVFSPTASFVRQNYQGDETTGVRITSGLRTNWDAACAHVLQGHTGSVYTIAFSHEGDLVASSSQDGTVRIWDTSSGHCVQRRDFTCLVVSISFSPNGLLAIALNGPGEPVKIWDIKAQQFAPDVPTSGNKFASWVHFSAHGDKLMVLRNETVGQSVQVWDLATSTRVRTINVIHRMNGSPTQFSVSADCRQLALAYSDRSSSNDTVLWDLITGKCRQTLEGRSPASFSAPDPALDPNLIVLGVREDEIEIRNIETEKCIHRFTGDDESRFGHSLLCLGPTFVASTSQDTRKIKIWSFAGACIQILSGHSEEITDLKYSPSKRLLASASDDHTIRIWDMSMDRPTVPGVKDDEAPIFSLKFSNNQQWLALARVTDVSGDSGGYLIIEIWDVATQSCIHASDDEIELDVLDGVQELAFSQNDLLLACTTCSTVTIWSTPELNPVFSIDVGGDRSILSFSFSFDCRKIAISEQAITNDDFKVSVWDLSTKTRVLLINLKVSPEAVEFSRDCEWIAVASPKKLEIHNLKSPGTILSDDIPDIRVLEAASSTDLRFFSNMGVVYRQGDNDIQRDLSERGHSRSFNAYKVSKDQDWILKGDEKVIWIPPDYRSSIAVAASKLAMSSPTGSIVWGELP